MWRSEINCMGIIILQVLLPLCCWTVHSLYTRQSPFDVQKLSDSRCSVIVINLLWLTWCQNQAWVKLSWNKTWFPYCYLRKLQDILKVWGSCWHWFFFSFSQVRFMSAAIFSNVDVFFLAGLVPLCCCCGGTSMCCQQKTGAWLQVFMFFLP